MALGQRRSDCPLGSPINRVFQLRLLNVNGAEATKDGALIKEKSMECPGWSIHLYGKTRSRSFPYVTIVV